MVQDMLMNIWRRGIKHTLFKYETPRSLGIIGAFGRAFGRAFAPLLLFHTMHRCAAAAALAPSLHVIRYPVSQIGVWA